MADVVMSARRRSVMPGSNVVAETPRSMSLTPTHTNTVSGMSSCAIGTCRLNALATVASRSAALTNTVARGNASRYTTRGQSSRNGSSRVSPRALPVPTTSSVCAVPAFDAGARLLPLLPPEHAVATRTQPIVTAMARATAFTGRPSPVGRGAGPRAARGWCRPRARGRSRRPPPRSRPIPAGRATRSRVAGSRGSG